MPLDSVRWFVTRHPWIVVIGWMAAAIGVTLVAPNLTRLAAEGQAKLLPSDAESVRAAHELQRAWPETSFESVVVVALERAEGLIPADRNYARNLSKQFEQKAGRPEAVLRVIGPDAAPEVAERLVSRDGTLQLLVVQLGTSFVSPVSFEAITWLENQARHEPPPPGLNIRWSGDAVIGRDYMGSVQESLDRAAVVTVILLLIVLLAVYRSIWLALIPLGTIGAGLAISRGVLAWMTQAGWSISPLVELFLVVILFGCGTDFCLYVSWRFAEHYQAENPAGAMRVTLRRSTEPLLTSAGTVIVGLSLMGLTKFKLFSSTGPSVAIGLAITLVASLTLTPALLVLLAKVRPRSFQGLVRPSQGFWDEVGSRVLAKPALAWVATVAFMAIPATIGLGTHFVQDLFSELPSETRSVKDFRLIAEKFGAGTVAPLTVVIRSDIDLRGSTGLALIDDVTRLISHQRSTAEVRSATRPLGNPATLEPARLASRLGAVSVGFGRLIEGADQMRMGLNQGAARLRTAMQIERATGMTLTGSPTEAAASARKSMMSGLTQATSSLMGRRRAPADATKSANPGSAASTEKTAGQPKEDPRETLLRELTMAADGASQISQGASRAQQELADILVDPVGRLALERLLINPRTIREHPELLESFAAYISPDGNVTRVDVTLIERIFSTDAMKQVETLRRRLKDHLGEQDLVNAEVSVTGANAQSADIWSMTTRDQQLTWIIVPIGVIVILWFALRDIRACVNLVATMLLTYAFALGVAHLVFVSWLGAPALDWKVPYFLFVLLVAVGVDYNIFLMTRLQEESRLVGLRGGIQRAIAQTGGLITSAAAITASSFAAFLSSPLASLRQLGLALVVGIVIDAVLVRPILVPCGHWLMNRRQERRKLERGVLSPGVRPRLETVAD